ncbi:hypothetical protein N9936_01330 [bacterium]|nr:hypothetical protein [bacterium]
MENPIKIIIKPSAFTDGYYIKVLGYIGEVRVFDTSYCPNDAFATEFKTQHEAQEYIDQHLTAKPEAKANPVHPSHYEITKGVQVWDAVEMIWGAEAMATHLEISAFEYRERAGKKAGQPFDVDIKKALNCLRKSKELREKLK